MNKNEDKTPLHTRFGLRLLQVLLDNKLLRKGLESNIMKKALSAVLKRPWDYRETQKHNSGTMS